MHLMQKGNAGLTTSIIGTSLAGLLALGAGNNGNGGFFKWTLRWQ
jgi:hypothetical protein